MDINKKSCAFTGHRKLNDDFSDVLLEKKIRYVIDELGVKYFYCGMAKGFDLIACRIVEKIKKEKDVKIIACIPCPEQEKFFNEKDKELYKKMIKNCDEIKIINEHYFKGCMLLRNKYMVDRSDIIISYIRENSGGTRWTVEYALRNKKQLIII